MTASKKTKKRKREQFSELIVWIPVKMRLPKDSQTVLLNFGDDGTLNTTGFYWKPEGSWYKSESSKGKRNAVHPVYWAKKPTGPGAEAVK